MTQISKFQRKAFFLQNFEIFSCLATTEEKVRREGTTDVTSNTAADAGNKVLSFLISNSYNSAAVLTISAFFVFFGIIYTTFISVVVTSINKVFRCHLLFIFH